MSFTFRPLGWRDALTIARWRYEGIYAFYNAERLLIYIVAPLRPLLNVFDVYFYAVDMDEDRCVGLFSYHKQDATLTIGLGLRPALTGRRLGPAFLQAGLRFGAQQFSPATFRLTVATFNQRAIRVYERAGFAPVKRFIQHTRGGGQEFMEMRRPVGVDIASP